MASVRYEHATRTYEGTDIAAVDKLDLEVGDGELLVLVGPSGSGKSTALRMLAGLEPLNDGAIRIGDRDVSNVRPRDRDIAMVFQNYALYPHKDVAANMGFALKLAGVPANEVAVRVKRTAEMLGIDGLLHRRPRELSGGQRQRVALGRAIVREPAAFLMDEPLSNLDAQLRVEMRAYLSSLHQRLTTTTVYVTHDQTEALTMGDRVAVLRDGRLEQVDTPQALYDRPANLFVARFIGSPAMNVVRARVVAAGDGLRLMLGGQPLDVPAEVLAARPALRSYVDRELAVGVRPETFKLSLNGHGPGTALELPVVLTESLGSDLLAHLQLDAAPVVADTLPGGGTRVTARLDPGAPAVAGRPLRVVVDTSKLHFFDPESGVTISVGYTQIYAAGPLYDQVFRGHPGRPAARRRAP
ncbi:MAG TPA: ABC transporter ATP-binding protein [Solirubrobacteraceae bacterium]